MKDEEKTKAQLIEELREQRRLRTILESVEDIVVVQDAEGRYVYYNASPVYGLRSEDVVGKTPFDFFDKEKAEMMVSRVKNVVESAESLNEETAVVWQGKTLWYNDTLSPVFDAEGWVEAVVTISRNITVHKELELRLIDSENRLKGIIDAEPECVKLLDSEGGLLEMNPAGLRMIEADSFGDVAGQSVYPLLSEKHRPDFEELVKRVFKGESGFLEFEITGLRGTRRWLEMHAVPVRDSAGEVTALLAVTRDVTEKKLSDEKLRQKVDELEQWQKLTVGRELKMVELKEEIADLKKKLNIS